MCPQISLLGNVLELGQWNINHLTDTKLEQIKLLPTANHHEINAFFLLETFLKAHLTAFYRYLDTRFSEKTRQGLKKGGRILADVASRLKFDRITSLDENELETIW